MNSNRPCFEIKPILDSLRASVGDSEFGLRMQALFAHVLLDLGSTVTEVNQQGHPDIKSVKGGKVALFQIKSISHSHGGWALMVGSDDIAGIYPSGPNEEGYFAVLDCAAPVSWVVSRYGAIRRHVGRLVSIETIRATADLELSRDSTAVFAELVLKHREDLHLLTFGVLRERALRGEHL